MCPTTTVVGSRRASIQGLSFHPHGSPAFSAVAHKAWGREEMSDWTQRVGYGSLPAYLERRPRNPRRKSLALPKSRSAVLQPAVSHLSLSQSQRSFSNATIRLVEHPIAWKWHENGTLQHPTSRPSTPADASTLTARDAATSRPSTPSPLCATYGLHPSFKPKPTSSRVNSRHDLVMPYGNYQNTYIKTPPPSRPTSRGSPSPLVAAPSHQTSRATTPTTPWRGCARPFPQDCAVRNDCT